MSFLGLHIELHPMVVHFPIAFFIGALVLEILSCVFKKENLHQSAFHVASLAVIAVVLAVLTGLPEADEWGLTQHPVFNLHKTFALTTLAVAVSIFPVIWLMRRKKISSYRGIFILFLALIVMGISVAAYNGGRLVYEYSIGVEEEQ